MLEEAKSAEDVIRRIIQAKLNERGNFGMCPSRDSVNGDADCFLATELRLPKGLPSNVTIEPIVKD